MMAEVVHPAVRQISLCGQAVQGIFNAARVQGLAISTPEKPAGILLILVQPVPGLALLGSLDRAHQGDGFRYQRNLARCGLGLTASDDYSGPLEVNVCHECIAGF